jgi:flagellar protein FliL
MLRKILPILLAILGVGLGGGAAFMLRPAPEPTEETEAETASPKDEAADVQAEYVKLPNQFIIPIVIEGRVQSLVVMSLSLEVLPGSSDAVFAKEPKLRDMFLQVLFDHANTGGFRGSFTDTRNLVQIRRALLEVAQKTMPNVITDVLIAEIARQDG